ncbi:sodium/calcium exchanger 1-like isoform X2 [Phyllopteryx taeniolatus]|uniref:sodium/calcium exchanger 1-like isoform X2 n=1 Tax=Phyllopteryx taeniolatus TaxID=161469 RepID=UPI002AD1D10E|nr:sodium/calcium exchanger 1-like isoform X2 [Phyllopteryx taeniolatus]
MHRAGTSSSLVLLSLMLAKVVSVGAVAASWNNTLHNNSKCGGSADCKDGVILSQWRPKDPGLPDRIARATIYFVGLAYMFLGVSIIADRFMASIEVITSQERQITVKKANGTKFTTTVRIWNETVSNLTLMALGSSAPEILLSVVEICGHNFDAGELGPNTIVGSAAFNMFVIIGLCVYVIPDGETRRVKHLRVFFVTATWSVFAYTWLYLILAYFSPGIVEIWEGLLTLFFFPVCVSFAYVADRRLLFYKYVYKRYRAGKRRGVIIETEGEPELPSKANVKKPACDREPFDAELGVEVPAEDGQAGMAKELKLKYPDKETQQLMKLATCRGLTQQEKSCAFYCCHASQITTGTDSIPKKEWAADLNQRVTRCELTSQMSENDRSAKVFFQPAVYQCLENCGSVALNLCRGGDLSTTVAVDFQTQDGTAKAGSDFGFTKGTVVFRAGETQKEIRINIIDDDIFEEEEHFLVHLSGVRVLSAASGAATDSDSPAGLGLLCTATVTIFDDDHAGIFTFEEPTVTVSESVGVMEVRVVRTAGARGAVAVPYRTIEGTAKGGGEDFEDTHGVLEFDNDEICKTLQINIIDDEEYEKNKSFLVQMDEPRLLEMSQRKAVLLREVGGFMRTDKQLFGKSAFNPGCLVAAPGPAATLHEPDSFFSSFLSQHPHLFSLPCHHRTGKDVYRKLQPQEQPNPSSIVSISEGAEDLGTKEEEERRVARMGRPMLGEHVKLEVVIEESYEFKSAVDKVLKKTRLAVLVETTSWREQFVEAITVSAGGGDNDDSGSGGGKKLPSALDYVLHFLTVFWKLLFVLVPPTDYWNGWACFVVSIVVIGILTAVIGDLASHFGCTVGLKDSVTAVVFVALGTSVPDTFASKAAASQDQYADASIGNVTGSNAVNVFLGIGVAWSIAAIYHYSKNQVFRVDPGTLAFSVTLFTIFAFICIAVLMYRRRPEIGGELGGPPLAKTATAGLFFSLWLMYIFLSSLEAYCHIRGF